MKKFFKMGCLGFIALIAIIVIISIVASGGDDSSDKTSGSNSSNKKQESKKEYTVGQDVQIGNLAYNVVSTEEKTELSSVLGNKKTDGKYIVVDLKVTNHEKKARMMDSSMLRIVTEDGTEYNPDAELDSYVNEDGLGFFLQEINPNMSKEGKAVFEIPADVKEYQLQVSSGLGWSGGDYQTIKLK
ncbi:DUF4352 domain-containing protein [Priestia aryabhattai]|uniref:DUF4352 domain-containing protein n=1 Tax=Priestia aryabhattai TaxID=412384 RepID=UPI00211B75CD|nr:DUF4352 domain-containing protein [Priestia aryabhattai]MCQ9281968.1 DUF4352 domain-containing protein [Priestia aryabhattai]